MRFYTIDHNGHKMPAVSADGGKTAILLEELGFLVSDLAEFVRNHSKEQMEKLSQALAGNQVEGLDLQKVKICAPIIHPDQDMICLGINYSEHAVEADRFSRDAFGGERPYTIYFSKRVTYATGNGDVIPSYEGLVDSLDYEVELGVVLGADVKGISEEDAEKAIFGYTVINDVSARNLQTRHKQWYMGKSLDGFAPMGPCIVTPDELVDPGNLGIRCYVNGQLRQNSSTRNMIQTVAGAIVELSAGMTLKAGTIIATGTPSGVGMGMEPPCFLKKGDVVTCEIEGIGRLENTVD